MNSSIEIDYKKTLWQKFLDILAVCIICVVFIILIVFAGFFIFAMIKTEPQISTYTGIGIIIVSAILWAGKRLDTGGI